MEVIDITLNNLKTGKLRQDLPEFYELETVLENNPWHDHETTFSHTLAVLKELLKIISKDLEPKLTAYLDQTVEKHSRKELLILATVFHDLGKKESIIWKDGMSFFPKHEQISVAKTGEILKRLDLSNKEKEIVLGIIKKHHEVYNMTTKENPIDKQFEELRHLTKEYFLELILMVWADTSGNLLIEKNDPQSFNFRISTFKAQLKAL